ncbi:MAG: sigma-54-dependent Fis family transcriptional regulator, partial [Acidobacteria bacterium]|nr:sigma-54-dependent Fis family transcriptional regulator [Acidobacteriota bacterium]
VAVDVRVVAATNKDLAGEIAAGRFREDLYFRIAVVTVRVPSLGERRDDILPLAREFARTLARRHGWPLKDFRPAAEDALRSHSWPGNVRELRNAVERALIMAPGDAIDVEHLGLGPAAGGPVIGDGLTLREARSRFERDFISRAIAANGGNLTRAAAALGVERSHLYRKLEALKLRMR